MKGRDIIKDIMKRQSVKNTTMSIKLGITRAALWDRLNTKKAKDIPLSTLIEMLEVLDYKVMIVPNDTELPKNGYNVTINQ